MSAQVERRAAIRSALTAADAGPWRERAASILHALGYDSPKTLDIGGRPASFAQALEIDADRLPRFYNWKSLDLVFQLTGDELPALSRGAEPVTGDRVPLLRSLDANRVTATLAQADQFIAAKHIPAAANYARSGCELLLREHCELKNVAFPYKPDPRKISFEDLKNGLRQKVDAPKQAALDAIGPHQSRVLNPLSHDPTIALNEAEVVAAIAAVNALKAALEA